MLGIDFNTYSIDFHILDTNDSKSIYLLDKSNYLFTPEKPRLFITPPGYTGEIQVEYPGEKNTIIEINSDVLELSKSCDYDTPLLDLTDGIYQITMAVCPYSELYSTKKFLKTTNLDCRIDRLLLQYDDCGCVKDNDFNNIVMNIDILIRSAKAEVNLGDLKRASMKYKKALSLTSDLENLLKCK